MTGSKNSTRKAVVVEWFDHARMNGWQSQGETYSGLRITSLGWFVHEDKDVLVISDAISEEGDAGSPLIILKKVIIKRKDFNIGS